MHTHTHTQKNIPTHTQTKQRIYRLHTGQDLNRPPSGHRSSSLTSEPGTPRHVLTNPAPFSPTPSILWFKKGGDLPAQKVKFENHNKTLKIVSVSEEDAGEYVCLASNHMGGARHNIHVQVKGEGAGPGNTVITAVDTNTTNRKTGDNLTKYNQ